MKKLSKTKKGILVLSILLILIIVLVIVYILNKDAKDDEIIKELKESNYTMYVSINPLIKVEFGESYYICTQKRTEKVCSDKTNKVTDFVLINDDAKELYSDIDLKGLSLIEALAKVYDTAKDKGLDFDTMEIIANYEFDSEDLKEDILSASKYKVALNISTIYAQELNENEIINNSEKYYTVTFDSNGGSKLESIKVKEGYGFTEPSIPTKSGYTFVEWQIDGKKYDFKTKVDQDITLKAKWEIVKVDIKEDSNTDKTPEKAKNNTTEVCTAKKFAHKYTYVYSTEEECMDEGNEAFLEVSDAIDDPIFTYGCEAIVDECGTTWYGVYFNRWADIGGDDVTRVYY